MEGEPLTMSKSVARQLAESLEAHDVDRIFCVPGESYVEYQLAAQKMRPDSFVLVAGYGEGGTGYIPTEKHWEEKDGNLGDWCWVHPGAEKPLLQAIESALRKR